MQELNRAFRRARRLKYRAEGSVASTSLKLPIALVALHLGTSCLSSSDAILASYELHFSQSTVSVGDTVQIAFEDKNGISKVEFTEDIRRIAAFPEGIIERQSDGDFLAVGAGRVVARLQAKDLEFETPLDVVCPPPNAADVYHTDETISTDVQWGAADGRHHVAGSIHVDGGTLTLGACTEIDMAPGSSIVVGESSAGSLIVRGSQEHPLELNTPSSSDARWGGIRIFVGNAEGSALRWLHINNAEGLEADTSHRTRVALDIIGSPDEVYDHAPIEMVGVTISNCSDVGLRITSLYATANPRWTKTSIRRCVSYPLSVDAASLGSVPGGVFEENGKDMIEVLGGWTGPNYQRWMNPGVPYDVVNPIVVAPDPSLSVPAVVSDPQIGGVFVLVEQGVTMRFHHGAGIYVGGGINEWVEAAERAEVRFATDGSPSAPVVLTSASVPPRAGDWVGVVFLPNSRLTAQRNPTFMPTYMSRMKSTIVEYAGAPSGLRDSTGNELRGGVIVSRRIPFDTQTPQWFLEGSTLRWNAGFGLIDLEADLLDPEKLQQNSRLSGFPSCFCGNRSGALWTASLRPDYRGVDRDCGTVGIPAHCVQRYVAW